MGVRDRMTGELLMTEEEQEAASKLISVVVARI